MSQVRTLSQARGMVLPNRRSSKPRFHAPRNVNFGAAV